MNRALRAPNTIRVMIPSTRDTTQDTSTLRRTPNHTGTHTDCKPESPLGGGRSRIATPEIVSGGADRSGGSGCAATSLVAT